MAKVLKRCINLHNIMVESEDAGYADDDDLMQTIYGEGIIEKGNCSPMWTGLHRELNAGTIEASERSVAFF